MQVCWTHRPESKLSHRHRRTDLGPFDRSFLFPKPLNCLPDSLRKKPCKQVARPNCASTVTCMKRWGLRASSLSTDTKADAGQNTSSNHIITNVLYMMLAFVFILLQQQVIDPF